MAKAASAEITISPKTDTAVMNVEIASPRGMLVNCQACSKPSNEKGTGREKAWPSTACAVVRSEERRVGKEGRCRGRPHEYKEESEWRCGRVMVGKLQRMRVG